MIALDYITEYQKSTKIPKRLLPVASCLVKNTLNSKYNNVKVDCKILDVIELSDLINRLPPLMSSNTNETERKANTDIKNMILPS